MQTSPPKVVAIIPARYHSNRFEGKPLAHIMGRPMIQHVVERARQVDLLSRVVVATDDQRIAGAVRSFGGEVVLTRPDHATGKLLWPFLFRIKGYDNLLKLKMKGGEW